MAEDPTAEIVETCGAGELEAYFQPIVDVATRVPMGAESLARWRRADGMVMPPMSFIPSLMESGGIRALTKAMLGLSLDAVVEWRDAGHEAYVAVNVNSEDLGDPGFAGDVARELIARDIPPTALVVEITERSILGDPEQAIETIDSLKGAGVSIALDDFGTGYSSLSHLVDLPVDALKLDQRFVGAMTTSAAHAAIVESMIGLSHRLGLKVVSEGIEDTETWEAIARVGSDRAQGFLCAHPTPGPGMLRLLGELDEAAQTGVGWHEAARRKAA